MHRNLSGKYRITALSETSEGFESLKRKADENLANGVYLNIGQLARIELMESNVDAADFYLANGGFTEKRYELLSYISGEVQVADASPYLDTVGPLPGSETQGLSKLDVQGNCFSNAPPMQTGYIARESIEAELTERLSDDNHPIVTLLGRGGIGKTSLALAATQKLTRESRFQVMLWFSARDLDLLTEGPKRVRPAVLSVKDVAREYVELMEPREASTKEFRPVEYLGQALNKSPVGPMLIVFDNFETISNPVEFYNWVDTHVRFPNKVLITTRQREFKGDYPIEVLGMTEGECNRLIDSEGDRLAIGKLITREYRQDVYRESDGHPYVVKILLGEVAKAGKLVAVTRIVADADEILTALFERTWVNLSPAAQKVYLTICNWRSTVPLLALQAVLLRTTSEKISVQDAIDELERSSFVEVIKSDADSQLFVSTPFVAAMFGKRKLAVSPMKSAVEADTEILQHFGPGQKADVRHGLAPRIERIARFIAERASKNRDVFEEYMPMLEYIARNYPPAWRHIAKLHQESGVPNGLERAKEAIRHYLEVADTEDARWLWRELADLCRSTRDTLGEAQALVESVDLPNTPYRDLSNTANSFNSLLREQKNALEVDERHVLVRRLLRAMTDRIHQSDATDCSRLAWLCLHSDDRNKAIEYTKRGLSLDPSNEYCQRLALRLNTS